MNRRKLLWTLLGLLLLTGGGSFLLVQQLPNLINQEEIKRSIEDGLHESTGVHFKIKKLALKPTLFHGIQLHLNTTAITDMRHHPLGDIGYITVQIRYLPILLERTPEIARIHIRKVRIPIGKYSLFKEIKLKLVKPKQMGFLKPAELADAEVLLNDYRIDDEAVSSEVGKLFASTGKKIKRFQVRGRSISIRHLESKKPIEVKGGGRLFFLQDNRKIALDPVRFSVNLAIPQAVVKAKNPQYHDLNRFDFKLRGKNVNFEINYQRKPKKDGTGTIQSPQFDLMQGQLFVLQLSDTFGFELPPIITQTYISGFGSINTRMRLRFPKDENKRRASNKPIIPAMLYQGSIKLKDVAASRRAVWPQRLVHRLNGKLVLKGETIQTEDVRFHIAQLPITLKGWVKVNRGEGDLQVETYKANLDTLKSAFIQGGLPLQFLQNRDVRGTVDLIAKVKGKLKNPRYFALLWLKDGAYQDEALGLDIQNVNGRIRFNGQGIQKLKYAGDITLDRADIASKPASLVLKNLKGHTKLEGTLVAGQPPQLPKSDGWLELGDGTYTHEQTGLALTGIHGKLLMSPTRFQVSRLQARLGGAVLNATGDLNPDFSRYQSHITSQNISIPRLRQEIPFQQMNPDVEAWLAKLNPTNGQADLDLTISTGAAMKGRLTVAQVNLQPPDGEAPYPVKIPKLSMLFDGHHITLSPASILYGPVEAHLEGNINLDGAYRLSVNTNDIAVETLRDSVGLINALSGLTVPEIWNTAGSFSLESTLNNQESKFRVSFNDAGLSWEGGDFPVYGVNGHLFYKRIGNGEDFLGTRDLSLYYANSPISIKAGSGEHFRMRTEGVFSDVLMNHWLVSAQSNASPYREVPFMIRAAGVLHGLPGTREADQNKIAANVHLDLNRTIKDAYKDRLPVPQHLKAPDVPLSDPPAVPPSNPAVAPGPAESRQRRQRARNPQGLLSRIQAKVQEGLNRFIQPSENAEAPSPEAAESKAASSANESTPPQSAAKPEGSPSPAATIERAEAPPSSELVRHSEKALPITERIPTLRADEKDVERATAARMLGDNAALDLRLMLSGDDLSLEKGQLHLFEAGDIFAQGAIESLFQPQQRIYGFHLYTQPKIALDRLSHSSRDNDFFRDAKGTLELDVSMQGRQEHLESVDGWIRTDGIAIPYLTLEDITGRIDFLGGENARGEIRTFKVPGVEANASATTDSLFELPVTLENVKINGNFLSIDSLQQFGSVIVAPIIIEELIHNFARPWQQGDPRIPIQFRDADLHFDEAILQNIIMSNVNSHLSVYANSFFELTNTSLEAAGGKVTGYFSMNPNENNFMTLELNADNVKANALTRALLGVTNQVFGDLDGTVRFTTFGSDDVEMQDNANGTVRMRITNGRLPAIAKVETLLATANLLRGGLLGFNLNNLFRSLTFYDTNYFAELSGDLLVANGVLFTDNLISDGVNLDLVIQGSTDMGTGDANMLVNGRMSQDVSGKLGALGKLSIGSILRYVPGLGTFGKGQQGLLGYLPGVGYVPGFGGPAGNFNYFQVRLVGQLDDPGAIRDFHWVQKSP